MGVIVKSDIIADVNDNLKLAFSGTELDRAIIKTLTDMSNRALLVGADSGQTLTSSSLTLDYPTGFRTGSAIITLTNSASQEQRPLIKLPGGHREYRELRRNDTATGNPESYSEFNKKFYLMRPPSEAFTVLIEYRKNHAKDADNIEFTTEFENLMFAGASFWYAMKLGRAKSLAIWSPIYQKELNFAGLNRNDQPSITRG